MRGTLNSTMSTSCLSKSQGIKQNNFSGSNFFFFVDAQKNDPILGNVITALDSQVVCSFTRYRINKLTDWYITTTDWLLVKFENTIPIFICILIITRIAAIVSSTFVRFQMDLGRNFVL